MDSVKIEEVNEGEKISYEQIGSKLIFDDMIMINCEKYQKDFDLSIDIVRTSSGNLSIGADNGIKYVAQIYIPAAQYEDVKDSSDVQSTNRIKKELDMSKVTLRFWSIN